MTASVRIDGGAIERAQGPAPTSTRYQPWCCPECLLRILSLGIIVKTGILLVDFAQEALKQAIL